MKTKITSIIFAIWLYIKELFRDDDDQDPPDLVPAL